MNTIDISPITHSYWSYVHQLSYLGGTTLYTYRYMSTINPPVIGDTMYPNLLWFQTGAAPIRSGSTWGFPPTLRAPPSGKPGTQRDVTSTWTLWLWYNSKGWNKKASRSSGFSEPSERHIHIFVEPGLPLSGEHRIQVWCTSTGGCSWPLKDLGSIHGLTGAHIWKNGPNRHCSSRNPNISNKAAPAWANIPHNLENH